VFPKLGTPNRGEIHSSNSFRFNLADPGFGPRYLAGMWHNHDLRFEMKTLHIDTEPTWRGGEQQVLYILAGLKARGLPATLLGQPGSPLLERARAAGIDARPFPMRGEVDLLAAWRVASLLRGEAFDIVHCHTPHAHSIAVAASWFTPRARMPKLVVARRVDFSIARRDFFGISRRKYNRADCIIAVSQAVREVLVRDGVNPRRIVFVREGIDVERIDRAPDRAAEVRRALGICAGERIVANIAHLTDHKGQRYLVEAVPAIRAARPDARVVIIGEGELRAALGSQARALGLGDALIFAGFRPPEEIPSILKAIDVFVFPSVLEGLGTSLFDAMAAGAPIVASRVGGIPEIVRDGESGLLVPPRDPRALAEAVARVLNDAALARRLSEAAQRFVRVEGTNDRMVEETIRVYEQLLSA
jgi:glycosyltransferase involved in cell wall biosynthesis